jgi:hypothetical protein
MAPQGIEKSRFTPKNGAGPSFVSRKYDDGGKEETRDRMHPKHEGRLPNVSSTSGRASLMSGICG